VPSVYVLIAQDHRRGRTAEDAPSRESNSYPSDVRELAPGLATGTTVIP
jgi:hypothetical protein